MREIFLALINLHSNMVRLKVAWLVESYSVNNKFTFQYGKIKS